MGTWIAEYSRHLQQAINKELNELMALGTNDEHKQEDKNGEGEMRSAKLMHVDLVDLF
jgi:hypothetical protein